MPTHATTAKDLLVTGATGMQGGAVLRRARHHGLKVSAMVRDPTSEAARQFEMQGIDVLVGDMDDESSLRRVFSGHRVVFSMQGASRTPDAEPVQAQNIASAAAATGVQHLIHTSVSGTGWRQHRPDYDAGAMNGYWDGKEQAELAIRNAGVAWSIIKPGFYMENFLPPKVASMFPLLAQGRMPTACSPNTEVALASSDDVGDVVARIAGDADRYSGSEIELAGDAQTFPNMAAVLEDVLERPVASPSLTAEQLDDLLGERSWSGNQLWLDAVGYPARPEDALRADLSMPTTFHAWAERHSDELAGVIAVEPHR